MHTDFVYLDEAVPGLLWDAKYATGDNFTGAPVDGYFANRVVGTKELARALQKALELAKAQGYTLLVWDAYRPACGAFSGGRASRRTIARRTRTIPTFRKPTSCRWAMWPRSRRTAAAAPWI